MSRVALYCCIRCEFFKERLSMSITRFGKLAAAAVAASLAFLAPVASTPASADSVPADSAAASAASGEKGTAVEVDTANGRKRTGTTLFYITVEDKVYKSYCIELNKPFKKGDGTVEQWGDLDAEKKNKVGWILENSYPKVTAEELGQAAGVEGLTVAEAIGATQGAVWHYTTAGGADLAADTSAKVLQVYKYLIGEKNVGVNFSDNEASVELDLGGDKTYKAGDKVGPITVTSSQDAVKLQAEPTLSLIHISEPTRLL